MSQTNLELDTVTYEVIDETIARITMNRPEVRNAQNTKMTYELDVAFMEASHDPAIKVIILAGAGPHWSSGHDMSGPSGFAKGDPRPEPRSPAARRVAPREWQPGVEDHMALEEEVYLEMCRRWHYLPKPTIAQCQGKTIAGGLMLAMVCDLVVAADDASFADPTVGFGVNGVEWFAHPWQFGARKAKELLFTGDAVGAEEALRIGFVNHVVGKNELAEFTLELARRIARRSTFALKLSKYSVNQTLDAQGFWSAIQGAFNLQHLGHGHARERFGMPVDPAGLPETLQKQIAQMREAGGKADKKGA